MARELTDNELHNIKAAIDFLRRLRDCCPGLRANSDFVSAFEELEETASSDETIREWWKAGDEEAEEEAVIERRLWVLWVLYVWIRADILVGDRQLSLDNCDGKEIAKIAFIMLHEAYHIDGWSDGESLFRQDLQNLATWEVNLLFHCPNFPCTDNILGFIKGRIDETINTINDLPWYKGRWFNINLIAKWSVRFLFPFILLVILVILGILTLALWVVILIALVITIIWWILEAIFG